MKKTLALCSVASAMILVMAATRDDYMNNVRSAQQEPYQLIRNSSPVDMASEAPADTAGYQMTLPAAGVALSDLVHREETDIRTCSMDMDEEDMKILLKIAAAEAGIEDVEGKALVMRVVLNRVLSLGFPDTIEEVVFQHRAGFYQFCTVKNGTYQTAEVTEECQEALDMVLSGWDGTQGALYFCRSDAAKKWHEENLRFLFAHGNHRFYTEKEHIEK